MTFTRAVEPHAVFEYCQTFVAMLKATVCKQLRLYVIKLIPRSTQESLDSKPPSYNGFLQPIYYQKYHLVAQSKESVCYLHTITPLLFGGGASSGCKKLIEMTINIFIKFQCEIIRLGQEQAYPSLSQVQILVR